MGLNEIIYRREENMNLTGLEAAIVPVTGGASGIGLAICRKLRAAGAVPILVDVNADSLETAVAEVYAGEGSPGRFGYVVDVADSKAVDAFFTKLKEDHGPATHAVANAGIVRPVAANEQSDENWLSVINVNLNGAFFFCRGAGRQMVEGGRGAIVNMGSIGGMFAREGRSAYGASKAGVIQMTRTLALEYGPSNVRVNAIAPGLILTPIQAANAATVSETSSRSALKRMGTPEEIADIAVYLLSDQSSFVTGATVVADGGLSIRYN
jgi:NAD(P)-dependent dehydrogenase (short-subunit alcohol dehydrogenase family)